MAKDYFDYLLTRSKKSYIFKRIFLYPYLNYLLPGKLIDIGCGIGDYLSSRDSEFAVGIDINLNQVNFCIQRDLSAHLFNGVNINWVDESFDSAILDNVIEHINDPSDLLLEINRVLTPGGRLVIGVPGNKGFKYDEDHKVNYHADNLTKLLKSKGFDFDCSWGFPFFLPNLVGNYSRFYCRYYLFRKV